MTITIYNVARYRLCVKQTQLIFPDVYLQVKTAPMIGAECPAIQSDIVMDKEMDHLEIRTALRTINLLFVCLCTPSARGRPDPI